MTSLIFLIVYVGLLHGSRALIVVTMLSILTGVTVGIMEWRGIFLTDPKIPDIILDRLDIIIYISIRFVHDNKNLAESQNDPFGFL